MFDNITAVHVGIVTGAVVILLMAGAVLENVLRRRTGEPADDAKHPSGLTWGEVRALQKTPGRNNGQRTEAGYIAVPAREDDRGRWIATAHRCAKPIYGPGGTIHSRCGAVVAYKPEPDSPPWYCETCNRRSESHELGEL